jgi:hypothetical protein
LDPQANKIVRQRREPLGPALGKAVLDHDVSALDIAEIAQTLAERRNARRKRGGGACEDHPDVRNLSRLRLCSERRSEQRERTRDERAAAHYSMT